MVVEICCADMFREIVSGRIKANGSLPPTQYWFETKIDDEITENIDINFCPWCGKCVGEMK